MRVNIQNCGEIGIIKDVLSHQLPSNAWTGGQNILMRDGAVHSIRGYQSVLGTPQVAPEMLQYYQEPSANWWLYAGAGKIYSINSGLTHTDISGAAYSTLGRWQGTFLNGVAILNNGVDLPQQWGGTGACAALSNWDTNNRCKVMRSYKEYLFALGLTESSSFTPTRLLWSDAADPGAVPGSWDYTDATVLAGRVDLASEGGHLLDMLTQQQYGMIYKEKSVIRVQPVGGIEVFRFDPAFTDFGVMATGCVADIKGWHAVFTDHDLLIHNGSSPKQVVEGKARRDLFNRIDKSTRANCFVAVNKPAGEVWYCYPELGETYSTAAIVYNFVTGAVSYRSIPELCGWATGDKPTSNEDWDSDTETWDEDLTAWNESSGTATKSSLFAVSPANTGLYNFDTGYSAAGSAIRSWLERTELMLEGVPPGSVATVTRVYPGIFSAADKPVKIWVGGRMHLQDAVAWSGPYLFYPESMAYVDPIVTARYLAIRFEFEQVGQWKLGNYGLDIEFNGEA